MANIHSLVSFFPPRKPLEVREANIKPTEYKACVLGLWTPQQAEGKRLVELAEALESGRWVECFTSFSAGVVSCYDVHLFNQLSCFPSSSDWLVVTLEAQTQSVWLHLVWPSTSRNSSRTVLCRY